MRLSQRVSLFFLLLFAAGPIARAVQLDPHGGGHTDEIARDQALLAAHADPADDVPFIRLIDDPLEPFNRALFGFNRALLFYVFDPIQRVYRLALPEPVRKSLGKAGHNLKYPGRLVNKLLQGRFKSAGVDTGRFLVNTTIGGLGFFDPAARWGMPRTDEDFGKTFARYGAGPGFYFMIPVLGPSSLRDGLGAPLDAVSNPASYIMANQLFMMNELSFSFPQLRRANAMERDPYATGRDLWALRRTSRVREDFGSQSGSAPSTEIPNPDPTLKAVYLQPKDPRFHERASTRDVLIPATGRRLPFSFWGQKKPAPLLFVVSGVGAHRLSDFSLALAEAAWWRGFAVVAVSNPMSWEFIERAGSRDVPGYPPIDSADLHGALAAIAADLAARHPGRFTTTGMIGLSLGGLHALFIAEAQEAGRAPAGFHLDRIAAINPPVDVVYALHRIDDYYLAPRSWPARERRERMENTLLRAADMIGEDSTASLAFSAAESQYLIGYFYRMILQQIIFSSQARHDLGVIKTGYGSWSRQAAYNQIERFSYTDYVRQFVMPYYLKDGLNLTEPEFIRRANLRWLAPGLREAAEARVFVNQDDFILADGDLDFLRQTFGERLTVFKDGGHLGNLYLPEVQSQVLDTFADLQRAVDLQQFKVVQKQK